jgi:hypothetical protein
MTTNEPQGDYGYDLVHEEVRAARVPDQRAEPVHDPRRSDPRRNVVSGDYSYDEAHGA